MKFLLRSRQKKWNESKKNAKRVEEKNEKSLSNIHHFRLYSIFWKWPKSNDKKTTKELFSNEPFCTLRILKCVNNYANVKITQKFPMVSIIFFLCTYFSQMEQWERMQKKNEKKNYVYSKWYLTIITNYISSCMKKHNSTKIQI